MTPRVEKQEARSKKQEARSKKQEARGKKQEARSKKQEARGKRQEARSKKQEARGKRQEARGKKQEARNKNQTKTKTIEIMCWNKVENQCKMVYEKPYINAAKPSDRKFIIHIISEEFPDFPRVRIASAVDRCLKIFPAPVERQKLLHFVQTSMR